ncbi:MAG: hypothetical protein HYZ00_02135, partial [Candidatus Hydrogenedentes bacterium]|nr:hypothetical protein [Candidatus Hydrogenedentota bacterium]
EGEGEGEGEGEVPNLQGAAEDLLADFSTLDGNADGKLSLLEARSAVPGLTDAQFAALDANDDDGISSSELLAFLDTGPSCRCPFIQQRSLQDFLGDA